jgi:hypothetical protein
MSSSVTYANIVTKQAVENWADQRGLVAEDQLTLHLEERFGARTESTWRVLATRGASWSFD